jgi:hypothetical protein
MERANRAVAEGRYVHTIPNQAEPKAQAAPAPAGYRPKRKTARRRPRR